MTLYAWAKPRPLATLPIPETRFFDVAEDARVLAHCNWQPDRTAAPTLLALHGLEGSSLAPYFSETGLVTAGSASGIGDGSASMVLASAEWAKERGIQPLGRVVSWAFVGVEPELMGIGPVPAVRKALERAGKSLGDMQLVEVNEAFAPQYVAVEKELGLDPEKTNVDGGAIALTHPLAASGARILVHLLHELRRRGGGFGVGSACVGGGQGGAVVIEAFGPS